MVCPDRRAVHLPAYLAHRTRHLGLLRGWPANRSESGYQEILPCVMRMKMSSREPSLASKL
jgi:hypothetical protein